MARERRTGAVRAAALTAAAGVATPLLLTSCRPGAVATAADDPTSGVVAAAAWVAWALVAYLAAGVCIAAAARLPGALGTAAARLQPLAPAVVRRGVAVAVGTTVATSLATGSAAFAAGPVPLPPVVTSGSPLDWPGIGAAAAPTRSPELVVRPGDTLWSLTARSLGPGASAAEVSAAWPLLYAANRAVVGADPDLIRPGMRLSLPRLEERTTR